MTPRAVLIGLPGTGKSTTGRRLAKILAVPFADSDHLIELAEGRSVSQIFADEGEAAFRVLESDTIRTALHEFDGVLSLGGGAVTHPATSRALSAAAAPVVLLTGPLTTLAGRVGAAEGRPLLVADPAARLAALSVERGPAYRAVADLCVDTEGRTPGQIAAHIAARLHERAHRAAAGPGGSSRAGGTGPA